LRASFLTPSMRLAVRVGAATFLAAMAFGGLMIARGAVLVAQGDRADAYASAGYLKLAHGVAMHGVLLLPALAWLLTFTPWDERRRTQVVAAVSVGYLLLVGAATWYSMR
jgi:hypothetical protein